MGARRIYCLKLTLVKSDGSSITDAAGLRLAGARQSISRELLADEEMNLHELHMIIQRLFGWKDIHLHKFSLMHEDFSRITCGRRREAYRELCGVIFICGDPCGFRWYWHELFKDMPYGSRGIPAKEAYCVNQYFARRLLKKSEKTEADAVWQKELPDAGAETEEETDPERVSSHTANILLERLRLNEILLPPLKIGAEPEAMQKKRIELWRKQLSEETVEITEKIKVLYKENPDYCRDMYGIFREYKRTETDFKELMRIKNCEETVRKAFGVDYETAREGFRDKILSLNKAAYDIINNYNPKTEPLFDKLLYSYDYGDEWCVRIECTNVYTRKPGFRGVQEERKTATWRNSLGIIPPELLHLKLEKAARLDEPLCIYSDGAALIEEIGGADGYFQFLKSRASGAFANPVLQ